ncbi:anthranilate synthase component I [bacterium]|nr:anthranilate synthase component I [bacterium]
MLADLETPVSVFRKLRRKDGHAFLLESVEGGESLGRWSFIGVDPAVIFRVKGDTQEIISEGESLQPEATPIATLRKLLVRYKPVRNEKLPPFTGGAVGYMGYDTVRYYERIPDTKPDQLGLPDCLIMIAETFIAFDHVRHRMLLVTNARVDEGANLEQVYREARERLNALKVRLKAPQPTPESGPVQIPDSNNLFPGAASIPGYYPVEKVYDALDLKVHSNFKKEEFLAVVDRSKDYITAGDIFQVVLSQRFAAEITCDPFDIYRALRALNPSPYMFYLQCGDEFQLAGSSPEILSKLDAQGTVTVRPIAGTRPRGRTPEEDHELERDLLADDKERAEHVMLVDLGRNDVGRVSKYASVRVTDFMTVERYSHVMHIVSNVEGQIAPGKDGLDVLAATFPAGTLTGAPKIRAMEIIDELERSRRGAYGGTIVYLGFNGVMDSCITIRTAVIKDGRVFVQAGGGLVADSKPEAEYMETVNKSMAVLRAVDLAERGLD